MSDTTLRRDLRTRHVTMLALGGTIGAGLFVGSGAVIADAGPAALISYAVGGFVVVLAMRMIAEMAVMRPSAGSLADWPREAIGGWAGFTTGWLYWYSWVVVIAFEATAGAVILQQWIDLPLWVLCAVVLGAVLGLNAISVRSFGEAEYWLALIKVVAIVAFIVVYALAVAGLWPGQEGGAPGLAAQPFAPNGWLPVLTGLLIVLFSYAGTEIVAVAAAEADDPERTLRKATRTVVLRIVIFYIVSIAAIVALLPTADTPVGSRPFAATLDSLGIPTAGLILDLVVIAALVSAMNSALYVSSRMLYGLAVAGDAPRSLARVDGRGVPRTALLSSAALSAVCVLVALVSPDLAFLVLLGAASAVLIPLYLLLSVSQLRLRRRWEREEPERLVVRMWWHPYGTYLLIAVTLAITVAMLAVPEFLPQVVLTAVAFLLALGGYAVKQRRARRRSVAPAAAVMEEA
jgi:GABA permease